MKKLLLTGIGLLCSWQIFAQNAPFPKHYLCYRTSTPVKIDGHLSENSWKNAEWTEKFVDIEGDKKPAPAQDTKIKMLWDDHYLYIAAVLEEKDIWAYQNKKDQIVFLENDFEVFLDPDGDTHNYFELEINALNNTFDLFLSKPYRNGGPALISWDVKGLKSAVSIEGTVNNPSDKDKRWTIEMAIPFSSVTLGTKSGEIPKDRSFWKANFSRVEWQTKVVNGKYIRLENPENHQLLPENNWVWTPQGAIDMHKPERWGYLIFSTNEAGKPASAFEIPYEEKMRAFIWDLYYKEQAFFHENKRFTQDIKELGLSQNDIMIDSFSNIITPEASAHSFIITLDCPDKNLKVSVNNDSKINTSFTQP
ncbi:Carbohydrate family 9 binding domain-like [Pseudarcicella hirudinis]|uniref:Carbohydrate family 9 binding domain-like n=1 Tax=Pseudarcicella hirudinis TaxID=1079859 RepID=A0A1I5P801_9BACT|nr:carbohydrate-binding family 9-like protein [Pseudarcicella hirudinis]SFP30224.1 Carbohydrate family 9 binding domain-like [Pseudarcicella hirudinis]